MASCCYGRQNGNSDKTTSFEHSTKVCLQAVAGLSHCNQVHHKTMIARASARSCKDRAAS